MKNIINSELIVPPTLSRETLKKWLSEHDYIIAVLQKACFDAIQYDVNDDRFADITPRQFQESVNAALESLEENVWAAIRKFESTLSDKGISPCPGWSPDDKD